MARNSNTPWYDELLTLMNFSGLGIALGYDPLAKLWVGYVVEGDTKVSDTMSESSLPYLCGRMAATILVHQEYKSLINHDK